MPEIIDVVIHVKCRTDSRVPNHFSDGAIFSCEALDICAIVASQDCAIADGLYDEVCAAIGMACKEFARKEEFQDAPLPTGR